MKQILTFLTLFVSGSVLAHNAAYHDATIYHKDCSNEICTNLEQQEYENSPKIDIISGNYRILQLSPGRIVIMDKETEHKFYAVIKSWNTKKDGVQVRFGSGKANYFDGKELLSIKGPFIVDNRTGDILIGFKGKYFADKRASVIVVFTKELKAVYSYIWLRDYSISVSLDQEITNKIGDSLNISKDVVNKIDEAIEAASVETQEAIDEAIDTVIEETIEEVIELTLEQLIAEATTILEELTEAFFDAIDNADEAGAAHADAKANFHDLLRDPTSTNEQITAAANVMHNATLAEVEARAAATQAHLDQLAAQDNLNSLSN